ncbi:MAG: KamA family radical SAM protein [Oligoflexia bacterium]|nr:KamA family radical SAM protein [Oligoflexia bacterium]MBF0364566.1 KamA family radical SAM protein [Oligoflexia bacterium]
MSLEKRAQYHPRTKATVTSTKHREFRDDDFWKELPGWANISKEKFADHVWQAQHSIRKLEQIKEVLGHRLRPEIYQDIIDGQERTPMNIRITPYIFALINWDDPASDPLRKQFLPLGSQFLPDHPYYMPDSLAEDEDSPVHTLTHRYPDKVLFLPLTTCPVYCSYCTRSRIVGGSTETIEKHGHGANPKSWETVFEYIRANPTIEDVIVSGGDAYNLQPAQLSLIGETLINIPHVRRIRYATKGIAIFPQRILTDDAWVNAFLSVHKRARSLGKQVVIHTHFSSAREITKWSQMAMDRLFSEGVIVRNQAVLQQEVNASVDEMFTLVKKLSYINVQPYYVFVPDLVPGCEHFRSKLREAIELEKCIRGVTAGFNMPSFVCDLPAGGGKRHVSSFEYYDEENGISVWKAPYVKPDQIFTYFDPIHRLSAAAQKRWASEKEREAMVNEAKSKVK